MKKLIAIMLAAMVCFAYAGHNDWQQKSEEVNPASVDRVLTYDESATISNKEVWFGYAAFMGLFKADTLTTCVKDVALDAGNAMSISLSQGDNLLIDYLYVESGFDASDYLCIETADSNGTELDTINLKISGRNTNTFGFSATQDTTLYLMFGDTTSSGSSVIIRKIIF